MTGTDHHVEIACVKTLHQSRRKRGIIRTVTVGHNVNIGLDVGEHAPDDVALAAHRFGFDNGAGVRRSRSGRIGRVIVEDVNLGTGERRAKAPDHVTDRDLLVVARQDHGDRKRIRHRPGEHGRRCHLDFG